MFEVKVLLHNLFRRLLEVNLPKVDDRVFVKGEDNITRYDSLLRTKGRERMRCHDGRSGMCWLDRWKSTGEIFLVSRIPLPFIQFGSHILPKMRVQEPVQG